MGASTSHGLLQGQLYLYRYHMRSVCENVFCWRKIDVEIVRGLEVFSLLLSTSFSFLYAFRLPVCVCASLAPERLSSMPGEYEITGSKMGPGFLETCVLTISMKFSIYGDHLPQLHSDVFRLASTAQPRIRVWLSMGQYLRVDSCECNRVISLDNDLPL
jgi:hypothetical protein